MTAATPGREELKRHEGEFYLLMRSLLTDVAIGKLGVMSSRANDLLHKLKHLESLRLAAKPADEDHPDCVTDRECELYDALMGLASHATAYHADYKQWTQGGVTLEPIVTRALRLSTGAPKP